MRARATITSCVLILGAFARDVQGADALITCSPMPSFLRFNQPLYPPIVESRGLPNPVSILVEVTISSDGRASDAMIIDSDAGAYTREFGEQTSKAVATWQFHRIPKPCRGRLRVVFKIAAG